MITVMIIFSVQTPITILITLVVIIRKPEKKRETCVFGEWGLSFSFFLQIVTFQAGGLVHGLDDPKDIGVISVELRMNL